MWLVLACNLVLAAGVGSEYPVVLVLVVRGGEGWGGLMGKVGGVGSGVLAGLYMYRRGFKVKCIHVFIRIVG